MAVRRIVHAAMIAQDSRCHSSGRTYQKKLAKAQTFPNQNNCQCFDKCSLSSSNQVNATSPTITTIADRNSFRMSFLARFPTRRSSPTQKAPRLLALNLPPASPLADATYHGLSTVHCFPLSAPPQNKCRFHRRLGPSKLLS